MRDYPAVIRATLAVGASVTAPYYDVNISQRLCHMACFEETPVFAPAYSVKSVEAVGVNQYLVTMHVEGAIIYKPCGSGCCGTRTQLLSQDFSIPVYSATAVTGATAVAGVSANGMVKAPCEQCSRMFVCDTPITLTLS